MSLQKVFLDFAIASLQKSIFTEKTSPSQCDSLFYKCEKY